MKAPAEPLDVVTSQAALTGKNERHRAFAAQLRCDITLREQSEAYSVLRTALQKKY
jgi:hypothetical protein